MSEKTTFTPDSYNDNFYLQQVAGSFRSAQRYAQLLSTFMLPLSVVDFGCGRGTWLKAFKEIGATRLIGLDGPWNNQDNMLDPDIQFLAKDLNRPICLNQERKVDLAISCEVAEHLFPESSEDFIKSITNWSDAVIFSAALRSQGGLNHINERNHSFWARLFKKNGFVAFDIFRPFFWGDKTIDYWYQQNTFFYVREGSRPHGTMLQHNLYPMLNPFFMDCVHPDLFNRFVSISEKPAVRFLINFEERLSTHPRILRLLKTMTSFLKKAHQIGKSLVQRLQYHHSA